MTQTTPARITPARILHPRPGHAPVIEVEVERTGETNGWITRQATGRIRATCPCNAPALGQWAYRDDVMIDLQATCIEPLER